MITNGLWPAIWTVSNSLADKGELVICSKGSGTHDSSWSWVEVAEMLLRWKAGWTWDMTDVGIKGESIVQDDSKTFDSVDLTKINRDHKRLCFGKRVDLIRITSLLLPLSLSWLTVIEVVIACRQEVRIGWGGGSGFCRKIELYVFLLFQC